MPVVDRGRVVVRMLCACVPPPLSVCLLVLSAAGTEEASASVEVSQVGTEEE